MTFASFGAAATSGGAGMAFGGAAAAGGSADAGATAQSLHAAELLGSAGAADADAAVFSSLVAGSAGVLLQAAEPAASANATPTVENKGRDQEADRRRMAFSVRIFHQEIGLRNPQETGLLGSICTQKPMAWSIFPPNDRSRALVALGCVCPLA